MCLKQTVRTPARMFRYVIQEAGTSCARRCPVLVIGTSKPQLYKQTNKQTSLCSVFSCHAVNCLSLSLSLSPSAILAACSSSCLATIRIGAEVTGYRWSVCAAVRSGNP